MKPKVLILLTISLAVSQAAAFHADIFLTQRSGELITGRGAADPGSGGDPLPGVRFHVNDIAGFVPFVDSNPGFSAAAAGDRFFLDDTYQPLPESSTLGFNLRAFRILNGSAANLFYWNGNGDIMFAPVESVNDYLEVRTAAGSALGSGDPVVVPGFEFTATDPQGAIHSHLTFDFDVDNNTGTVASTGVFLAAFEFTMELTGDATRETSRPHYIAWFNGPPGAFKSNAMAATEVFLADNFAELRLFGDVRPFGGDDLPDDVVDSLDIDALLAAINRGSTDLVFDLNGDTSVDPVDSEVLFDILGTQFGDANLDSQVDYTDLSIWQANYGMTGDWAKGDFNGDANVDGRDFLLWQQNVGFGLNLVSVVAVPEPAAMTAVSVAIVLFLFRSHRDHRANKGLNL